MITIAGNIYLCLTKLTTLTMSIWDWLFSRMDRQRREDELKNRGSKKAHEAEQSILNRVIMILLSRIICLILLSNWTHILQ